MIARLLLCWLALGLATSGCDRPDAPTSQRPAATLGLVTATATSANAAVAPEPYADAALPDPADFAAEAERQLTADNVERELDELESALERDAGPAGAATASVPPPR